MKKILFPIWAVVIAAVAVLSFGGLSAYTFVRAQKASGQLADYQQGKCQQALYAASEQLIAANDSLYRLEAASTHPQRLNLLKEGEQSLALAKEQLTLVPDHRKAFVFLDSLQKQLLRLHRQLSAGGSLGDEDNRLLTGARATLLELSQKSDQAARENNLGFLSGLELGGLEIHTDSQQAPEGTALNQPEVSGEQAKEVVDKLDSTAGLLTERQQPVAVYRFGSGNLQAEVTKAGGRLYAFRRDKASTFDGQLTAAILGECMQTGSAALTGFGYPDMQAKFWRQENGELVMDFYPEKDGVTYYSDGIRLWINLENREITGMNAHDYLVHHREREREEIKVKEEQIRELVKGKEVQKIDKAVFLSSEGQEISGWQVSLKGESSREYLVLFDGKTGQEWEILSLYTGQGNRSRQ